MTVSNTQSWCKKHRIAVLKGGWSRERSISLKTGKAVEDAFKRLGIKVQSIDVQPNIADVLKKKKTQFAFICLHGTFGEDGRIQSLLDVMGIPYSGSNAVASSLAMNKGISKILFREAGVMIAPGVTIVKDDFQKSPQEAVLPAFRLFKKQPVFVKPVDQGSAIGISKVSHPRNLKKALKLCFKTSDAAMVESFVSGREFTVGILDGAALPVVEILPVHSFYDYHSKYAKGGSRHIVPAPISSRAAKVMQRAALKAFTSLGCSVYGRMDFIMRPNGQMVALEMNTIPGMTSVSLLPAAASSAGISFDQLVLRIVAISLQKKRGG